MSHSGSSRRLRLLRFVAVLATAGLVASCAPGSSQGGPTPTDPIAAAGSAGPTATAKPARTVDPASTPAEESAIPASPTPSAAPSASSTPAPRTAAPADPKPFAMNLYGKGDYVAQYTFEWCVGASVQMTLNMATKGSHTTRAEQQRIWEMARDRSFSPFGGANPRGWTAVLNDLDVGPYVLVSLPTFDEALNVAAKAVRQTDRPVGLVMWRGRHAWMMSGFESTADPRAFDDFEVTGIRVLDPLHPHGSSVWGRSPKPNSLVSPETLAKQYVLRDSTRVDLGVPPGYLLVLPVGDEA